MSAIDRILTPIVAQSSEDASLTMTARFALCGVELCAGATDATEPPEPPPLQAARIAAARLTGKNRTDLSISKLLELTIIFSTGGASHWAHRGCLPNAVGFGALTTRVSRVRRNRWFFCL